MQPRCSNMSGHTNIWATEITLAFPNYKSSCACFDVTHHMSRGAAVSYAIEQASAFAEENSWLSDDDASEDVDTSKDDSASASTSTSKNKGDSTEQSQQAMGNPDSRVFVFKSVDNNGIDIGCTPLFIEGYFEACSAYMDNEPFAASVYRVVIHKS
jgi:hypothetical protein